MNLHTTASKAAGLPLADTRISFIKQNATSESNRPDRIGSSVPLPLGQWHHSSNTRRKERELNSQGIYTRSASNGVPSPIGLPFHIKSSGSRNRTCVWAINSRLPVPTQDPPEYVSTQSGWSDLNRRSRAPEARGVARLSHTLINEERPARIELAIPPWQGDGLPLHHGRLLLAQPNCQRSRALSENRTHATALRKRRHSTRPSVLIHLSGIGGHRTHIDRIKSPVHYLVCHNPVYVLFSESAWKESNLRLASYKDATLTTELHAVVSEWGRRGSNSRRTD